MYVVPEQSIIRAGLAWRRHCIIAMLGNVNDRILRESQIHGLLEVIRRYLE